MFGMPGQNKSFGMGVVLDMKNNMHGSVQTAIKDFEKLHGVASELDKKMITSAVRWNRGMDLMASATRDFVKAGVIAGGVSFIGSIGRETEQAYADLRSLRTKGMEGIESDMRKMFIKEKLPIPFKDALSELYNLKSAGAKDADLTRGMKSIATTALATKGTMAEAMNAYTNTYNLFFGKMGGSLEEKNQRFADVFSSSVMQYKTKLPELNEQFSKVANKASMMGMKLEEAIPALGTLLTAGMGERTGESLRSALDRIGIAGEKLGLKFVDSKGKMIPLLGVVDKLKKKFGDTLTVEEADRIREAFGDVGSTGILTLMSLRDQYSGGIKAASEYGISQEMAGKITDTLNFKFVSLKNSLSDLGDQFSKNSGMKDMVDSMTNLINTTSEFIKQNPAVAKTMLKLAEALTIFYVAKGGVKAGKSLLTTGAAMATGVGGIYAKVKTGTWQPWKWFPKSAGAGAAASGGSAAVSVEQTMMKAFGSNIMGGASKAAKPGLLSKMTGLMSKLPWAQKFVEPMKFMGPLGLFNAATLGETQLASFIASKAYPLKTRSEAPDQSWLYKAIPGEMEQKELSQSQRLQHEKYFGAASDYVPVVQAPYSDQRKLEVNVTINGQKVDAELLSDSQIDRITQKFSDVFFVNPLRIGTQGAPLQ